MAATYYMLGGRVAWSTLAWPCLAREMQPCQNEALELSKKRKASHGTTVRGLDMVTQDEFSRL